MIAAVLALGACGASTPPGAFDESPEMLLAAADTVTEVMVASITSPPVASRTYAYASIAAYETLRQGRSDYRTLAGQLNELEPVPEPAADDDVLLPLASVVAFLSVAERLVFAPERVAAYRQASIDDVRRAGVPRRIVESSVAYGEQVAQHVLAWAAKDRLKEARGLPRFEVRQEPGRWQPTPPAYMDAVEPNWPTLRPFTMDSAGQLRPVPPVAFDSSEASSFRQQVLAVYRIGRDPTDEQREIAAFWDCNPFAVDADGHFMSSMKKITPGGHWIGIAGIALRSSGSDLPEAAETLARVSIAIADGFTSAWAEKYRTVLVRPETIINARIDPAWRPLLQTPPFPEYPSAHSVISAAAAEVLTRQFGDDFAFDDDVEVRYGLPVRSFTSFRSAAEEAAMSRLYGGIHYPMAVSNGLAQGREVGRRVLERAQTRTGAYAAHH